MRICVCVRVLHELYKGILEATSKHMYVINMHSIYVHTYVIQCSKNANIVHWKRVRLSCVCVCVCNMHFLNRLLPPQQATPQNQWRKLKPSNYPTNQTIRPSVCHLPNRTHCGSIQKGSRLAHLHKNNANTLTKPKLNTNNNVDDDDDNNNV